jgi:hypothetical protein
MLIRSLFPMPTVIAALLVVAGAGERTWSADVRAQNQPQIPAVTGVAVGYNFNGGDLGRFEFPEHIFRSAAAGQWPVPAISTKDLAEAIVPIILAGRPHPLSGEPQKLTDGAGPADDDAPGGCFFFDNGVRMGTFRISLPSPEDVGQINTYSWHRNALSGGIRAPHRIDVYASDGSAEGFQIDDPHGRGYRLIARIDSSRQVGVNEQSGQHGSSIYSQSGRSIGRLQHFIFHVHGPIYADAHSFICEIDIVQADEVPELPSAGNSTGTAHEFDEHIGRILARRCLECHNSSERSGGLDLSRLAAVTAGGDSGPPIEPGKPDESYLIQRIEAEDMPPEHPLPEREKDILRNWVAAGAPWGSNPIDRFRYSNETRAGYDWWALKPLEQAAPPKTNNAHWAINEIDHFILGSLEENGLGLSSAADRRTLIRRVTFDLIGLPPHAEEVDAFVADKAPNAYERLVERLLSSPHYGERWARHWLDLVRFAESQGFERNKFYPSAWKYRDWVIHALNEDLPYDEFVRLQLAGDVLRPDDPLANAATGYLVCGTHDLLGLTQGSEAMRVNTHEDELENVVGNVGQTFLGMTINCARCHDHKFDPLYQREYFQLAAALGGVERSLRVIQAKSPYVPDDDLTSSMQAADDELSRRLGSVGTALLREGRARSLERAREALKVAKGRVAAAEKQLQGLKDEAARNAAEMLADRWRDVHAAADDLQAAKNPHSITAWDEICDELAPNIIAAAMPWVLKLSALEQNARLMASGPIQGVNSAPPQFFHVLVRGNFREPSEVVTPRGFKCLKGPPSDWGLSPGAPEAERRVRLADWITDPQNPLVSRVIVNRLWQNHFGAGLVKTPNDFGFNGGHASHPQLLDWLAIQLIENGWSLKHIHRLVVLSNTYRQSSANQPRAAQIDVDNRWLWRMTPRRLEAEALRDAVLAVSGQLNRRMGGPSFRDVDVNLQEDNAAYTARNLFNPTVNRRTIYRTVVRSATPTLLETLDCADPAVSTPSRTVTTTPLQALSLLNNPFMREAAAALADRSRHLAGDDLDRQIEQVYRWTLQRKPTTAELESAGAYAAEFGLADFCLALFNSNEFVYID